MKQQLQLSPRANPDCLKWLDGSALEIAERRSRKTGPITISQVWLMMKRGDQKVTVAISKSMSGNDFTVIANMPGTNVKECGGLWASIPGKNVPDAARGFIEKTRISNPKNLPI